MIPGLSDDWSPAVRAVSAASNCQPFCAQSTENTTPVEMTARETLHQSMSQSVSDVKCMCESCHVRRRCSRYRCWPQRCINIPSAAALPYHRYRDISVARVQYALITCQLVFTSADPITWPNCDPNYSSFENKIRPVVDVVLLVGFYL